jgi:putative CocE/NonD family hydrolase
MIAGDRPCSLAALLLLGSLAIAGSAQRLPPRDVPETPLPALIEMDKISIPMRDGVQLTADLYLPPGSGRWPTILIRTPYSRRSNTTRGYRFFAEHGYAVVAQDVRGRYGSAGIFGSIAQEGPDGNDTINWIARQVWSNGRIGMAGASYVGMTQWWAAIQRNPHLVTIFPIVSGNDEYMDRYYSPGGAVQLGHRLVWLSENLSPRGISRPQFQTYINHLPLQTADVAATTLPLEIWRIPMAHPSYDSFWTRLSIRFHLSNVDIPVCSIGGWFDNYAESDLQAFSQLSKQGRPVETWIGPWPHNFITKFPTVDFGATARPHIRSLQLAWFDRYLRTERSSPQRPEPLLHLFVMGDDTWRDEHEWPLARTRFTPFYLESHGHANSASGDGQLRTHLGGSHQPDHFLYDPRHPVPTRGGAICCNPQLLPPGPLDQTAVEGRSDVLVYTSEPLSEATEVTGPVGATLYIASSANDTDFTAKLVDVSPSGQPLLVTDGIMRLRYRISLQKPVFVKRNSVYQLHIDAGVTSWVFLRGHRIRLEVSSSNFPRFDRNLNSDRPNSEETRMAVASQIVFHNRQYPSVLVLPVIPRVRSSFATAHSHGSRAS